MFELLGVPKFALTYVTGYLLAATGAAATATRDKPRAGPRSVLALVRRIVSSLRFADRRRWLGAGHAAQLPSKPVSIASHLSELAKMRSKALSKVRPGNPTHLASASR